MFYCNINTKLQIFKFKKYSIENNKKYNKNKYIKK